jgi:hypothetical protein
MIAKSASELERDLSIGKGNLLRHHAGKLLIIWDGSSTHHSQVIKDFQAADVAECIDPACSPGYAP